MRSLMVRGLGIAVLGLTLALATQGAAPSATPAKIDSNKLLPDDTEAVVAINLKQLFESPLIKKLDKKDSDTDKVKKELGFDPMKDLESVVFAIPGGGNGEKALIIINGTFDAAKLQAKADEAIKAKSDHAKVHEVEDGTNKLKVYEITDLGDLMKNLPPQVAAAAGEANPLAGKSLYAGFDQSAVLVSGDKDQVIDALKKSVGSKKTELKSKEMKDLLTKIDAKRTLSLAILASCIGKEATDKFESITGGITVGSDIQTEITVNTKDEKAAKALSDQVDQGLQTLAGIVPLIAAQNKGLEPVGDVVKGIKSTVKDQSVTIKSTITEEALKQIGEGIQEAVKKQLGGAAPGGEDK
ncbi:MAG TPA: hypothetical protein VGZ25_09900 [Gemmataceae bacterium]|nr:hypothetical protein [Gemmataceae bacterium]